MNREPKLEALRVQRRATIYSQEVTWDFGPNFGDNTFVRVQREGKSVSITSPRKETLTWTVEQAKLIHQALGRVIEAAEGEL